MPVNIQTQRRTPQVLGPNRVVDAVEIGATTEPSNIYFQVVVRYTLWTSGLDIKAAVCEPIADAIEYFMTEPAVVGMEYVEDLDAAGLVKQMMEVTVEYVPADPAQFGPMTTTFTAPVERFETAEGRAVIQSQINRAIDVLHGVATTGQAPPPPIGYPL